MKKKIEAIYYFTDIGAISLITIVGFAMGINKWLGILGTLLMTLFLVSTSVYLSNK